MINFDKAKVSLYWSTISQTAQSHNKV